MRKKSKIDAHVALNFEFPTKKLKGYVKGYEEVKRLFRKILLNKKLFKYCKIHLNNREIRQLIKQVANMLPKSKNPLKTRANFAKYCFSINTYTTIREMESKLRKTAGLKKPPKNKLILNLLSKSMKNNRERVNLPKLKCILYI